MYTNDSQDIIVREVLIMKTSLYSVILINSLEKQPPNIVGVRCFLSGSVNFTFYMLVKPKRNDKHSTTTLN